MLFDKHAITYYSLAMNLMDVLSSAQESQQKVYLAGPCSAESYDQLRSCAQFLQGKAQALRVGVWKPRSRPGEFEGYGEKALEWIYQLKMEFPNLPVLIEIATPAHLEKAMDYGIDGFWVGARTTSNPFMMDELASSLAGVQKLVLVKNPIAADLGLWLGAVERLEKKLSARYVAAIHRGFCVWGQSQYRNHPFWELALEFRKQRPEGLFYCDPSHMAGRRNLVFELACCAGQLDYDGMMVEVHPRPQIALSDSKQQLSFTDYELLMQSLTGQQKIKNSQEELSHLRALIDQCDSQLIANLRSRFHLIESIAQLKKKTGIQWFQADRYQQMMAKRCKEADSCLSEDFLTEIFNLIHSQSVKWQALAVSNHQQGQDKKPANTHWVDRESH